MLVPFLSSVAELLVVCASGWWQPGRLISGGMVPSSVA